MKNKLRHLQLLAAVALCFIMAMAFTSCGNDDEPDMPNYEEMYQWWLNEAEAQYDVVQDGMAFRINAGEARLEDNFIYLSGTIKIPSEVYYVGTGKSYPVTFAEIRSDLPEGEGGITSISIPSTVIDFRVYGVHDMKSITIPSSVTYLDITLCNGLTNVTLTEGNDNVGISACPKITSISIPESVTDLRLVALPIKELTVPSGLTGIEARECKSLEYVKNIENTKLRGLGSSAFWRCESLKEITLPATCSYVTYGSFEECTSLNKVHVLRATPPTLRDNNYRSEPFSKYDNLYVPKGSKEAYKEAFPWSMFKEIIEE